MEQNGIVNQMGNVPMYDADKLTVENFNKAFQEAVEAKYPDYKDNQITNVVVDPLEQNENIETRRINNLQKQGIDAFKPHKLIYFDGVKKHKSVWRAMRRGHTSVVGEEFPNRPFNNRKNKAANEVKKQIYGELTKGNRI